MLWVRFPFASYVYVDVPSVVSRFPAPAAYPALVRFPVPSYPNVAAPSWVSWSAASYPDAVLAPPSTFAVSRSAASYVYVPSASGAPPPLVSVRCVSRPAASRS